MLMSHFMLLLVVVVVLMQLLVVLQKGFPANRVMPFPIMFSASPTTSSILR
jgi:hypothetical protein